MAKQAGNSWRAWGRRAPIALLTLIILVGCAGQSEMTNLWKDPTFASGPVRDVLIVALRKDPVRRRMWEDAFARGLTARGVTATSSYQLFQELPPDTQQVVDAVRKNGYDAVLVSIRLPSQTSSTYVPGTIRSEMVTRQNYFGAFHTYWVDVLDPGHTEIDEIRRVETDLWVTGGQGRLVWSGTLNTLESVSNRTMETAVSRDILPLLERQGLIPPRK